MGAVLMGCSGSLDPSTNEAHRAVDFWWGMFAISVVVAVVVLALIAWALLKGPDKDPTETRGEGMTRFIVIGGGVIPVVILVATFLWSLDVTRLSGSPAGTDYVIQVTGHQFWYEVHYPAEGITVRDQMEIPSDRRTRVEVTSADVIHSLWIPELNGKIDMFPGRTTHIFYTDPAPGHYEARCAEFCGVGHALMRMGITVATPDEFAAWVAQEQHAVSK